MEKLNYFLFLKKMYNKILQNLQENQLIYEEILNSDYAKERYLEYEFILKKNVEKQIEDIKYYIDEIENQIINNCKHELVEDLIDIDPENSKIIRYCEICEYTFS